jgi:F-type H+/Na+-transporting ATPase subunit beta
MSTTHQTVTPTPNTAQRVEFFLALQSRNANRVQQLAQQSPGLVGIFTEWAELDNHTYWPLGYTALHYATGIGDQRLVDILLTTGADVNAPSKQNFATPLHVAVQQQRPELVKQLLAAGANVGAANYNGQSALHFAAYRGNQAITAALLEAGASPALKDASGRTPLDWAIYRNHKVAADLLRQAGGIAAKSANRSIIIPAPDTSSLILETGIKLIDLFAPLARGSSNALFTPLSGVGKVVVLEQLIESMKTRYAGETIFLGIESAQYKAADFAIELNDVGLQDAVALFFASSNERKAMHDTVAQALKQVTQTHETLIMVDARFGEPDDLQMKIEAAATQTTTILWYGDHTAGIEPERFASAKSVVGFEMWRAMHGYWPSIDPVRSHSAIIPERQATLVAQAQRLLRRYEDLRFIVEHDPRGIDALTNNEDHVIVARACKLHAFLSQPFTITELWTNTFGEYVPLAWALDGLEAVLTGQADDVDEAQLRLFEGTHRKIRR